ncbi:MAG: response regulator [Cephaloticoccus sp.]|nr:response regulator [Cephaloticoccus sp.]MCF7759415.1 response regulator [Cephaloticoccus sp.]
MSTNGEKSVIIVDDEKSYGDLLSQLIRHDLDRPVLAFNHPLEALDALPNLSVAVVVTDYFMPVMDGVQFIRRAAPQLPGISFIMITGHPMRLTDETLDDLPALRAVLPKPFKWHKLSELIVRHWPAGDDRPTLREPD